MSYRWVVLDVNSLRRPSWPSDLVGSFDMGFKRSRMSRKSSKANFTKHASKTHRKNVPNAMPMRGGIRL